MTDMPQIIELTQAAARRLSELEAAGQGRVVRLGVKSSGCSGNKYDLAYRDAPGPLDEKVQAHGATLYVDPLSLIFIAGTKVDWIEGDLGRAFSFENPNESARCGCGESFTTN